ncbi:MAG: tetratricopeptide repeat protein, partial [Thermodesulfovibrionales bacterium]
KAMEEYSKAINEDISWAPAYHGMGVTYMLKRDIRHAETYFKRALEVEPDNVFVLSDMADLMLIKRESPEKALAFAERAIAKTPPFYQPYLAMGNVLLVTGREDSAERFYREASERGAKEYMILLNKARIYYLRGDGKRAEEYLRKLKNIEGLPLRVKELIH